MTDGAVPRMLTLGEIARALDARLVGDASAPVAGVDHPARARADQIALAVEPGALKHLAATQARVAVVAEDAPPEALTGLAGHVVVKRARVALSVLTGLFQPPPAQGPGVHPQAFVDPAAVVDPTASVGPLAYVGPRARIGARTRILPQATVGADAVLGADCTIHYGARIGDRVRLGDRVVLHANACLGADGFSFVTPEPGSAEMPLSANHSTVTVRNETILKIHSLGTVVIEDDVEIGACSTVDRATLGETVVKRSAKIDNLVQIAHNCVVGENCLIAGQVGLSGSVRVGDRVVMGGQVGVGDHLKIGDDAVIGGGAGIAQDVPAATIYIGYPAGPVPEKLQENMNLRRLPRLIREMVDFGKRLATLERRLASPGGG